VGKNDIILIWNNRLLPKNCNKILLDKSNKARINAGFEVKGMNKGELFNPFFL